MKSGLDLDSRWRAHRERSKGPGRRFAPGPAAPVLPIRGFMTVCCIGRYRAVLEEILDCVHESRLYDKTKSLDLAVLGAPEDRRVVEQMIRPFQKIRVAFSSDDIKEYEFPALALLQTACRAHNMLVYYLHTKGVSHAEHDQHERYWLALMLHCVVERHADCVDALARYGAAGTNWQGNHFSGNFWWASSRHIRSLPDIRRLRRVPRSITSDPVWNLRLQCEFWIGMTRLCAKDLSPSGKVNLYKAIRWHTPAADVLRWLLAANAGARYLELRGAGAGAGSIGAPLEHIVSHESGATFRMSESEFFASGLGEPSYDVIFIDSPRNAENAFAVIEASLTRVAPGGALVVRHTNPPTAGHARAEQDPFDGESCGQAWQAVVRLRLAHPTLSVVTVDTDWGCSVLRPWAPATPALDAESARTPTYERFAANRAVWLNLVSPRRFRRDLDYVPKRLGHAPIRTSVDVVNSLVSRFGLERYLEIGARNSDENRADVIAPIRQRVHPVGQATFRMTSDEFFSRQVGCDRYDLVFVDGDDEGDARLRAMESSLSRLAPRGFIVVRETNPSAERKEALVRFKERHAECDVVTVDVDGGCAIIRRSDRGAGEGLRSMSVDEFRGRFLE